MQRLHKYEKIASSDPTRYETWQLSHNCYPHYAVSSLSLSKEKHGLHYISFYGDIDSRTHLAVKDIYGPSKPIKKLECVGHC